MRAIVRLIVVCAIASACAPPGPPNRPPAPSPPPDGEQGVLVVVPPDDPRLVRCGVDDRPRSVVGLVEGDRRRLSAVDRAFFGDRPAIEAPNAGAPMAKPMIAREPPPVPQPNPRPPLLVTVEPPRPVPGGAMPSGIGALRPDLASCEDVLEASDVGAYGLEIAIASTGAPTEVRLGERASPSKFVRCAMERLCQVRAAAGDAGRVVVPIVVRAERAVEIPPPPPPTREDPPVPVRVTIVAGNGSLRGAAERAGSQCVPNDRNARIRIQIELRRVALGGNGTKPGEKLERISRSIEGKDAAVVACTMRALFAHGFAWSSARREIVEITWNP